MIQKYIIHEGNPQLLLFFAGWGADETPFKAYRPAGSDFMICYDYRDLSFDADMLKAYEQVNVVGWSMGVWAASQTLGRLIADGKNSVTDIDAKNSIADTDGKNNIANADAAAGHLRLSIGKSIAINGTPFPIDEERGIPPAIYRGTLEGLTDASLHKFLRRMCADSKAFREFLAVTPRRPLEELREELAAIETAYTTGKAYPFGWDVSIVAAEDRIIPPGNQQTAWTRDEISMPFLSDKHLLIHTDKAHYDRELFETWLEKEWTSCGKGEDCKEKTWINN